MFIRISWSRDLIPIQFFYILISVADNFKIIARFLTEHVIHFYINDITRIWNMTFYQKLMVLTWFRLSDYFQILEISISWSIKIISSIYFYIIDFNRFFIHNGVNIFSSNWYRIYKIPITLLFRVFVVFVIYYLSINEQTMFWKIWNRSKVFVC